MQRTVNLLADKIINSSLTLLRVTTEYKDINLLSVYSNPKHSIVFLNHMYSLKDLFNSNKKNASFIDDDFIYVINLIIKEVKKYGGEK